MKTYIWNILIAIDQLVNTLFGGFADESISSRAAKAQIRGKKMGMCLMQNLR